MEFFTVPCPGNGEVWIDKSFQGASVRHDRLFVFQCGEGMHNIGMQCLIGRQCELPIQRVSIIETDPIEPLEIPFRCTP
ncbi:MAG: hypothetical protein HZB62_03750 [Nitrospirae bacterium]|nr:hypothetical protein [Nitrospirota bacterium]